jgi:hypothetical protein
MSVIPNRTKKLCKSFSLIFLVFLLALPKFAIALTGLMYMPIPWDQVDCGNITDLDMLRVLPIHKVSNTPPGTDLRYANSTATVDELCRRLNCGPYVCTLGASEFNSCGDNEIIIYNNATSAFQKVNACVFNSKITLMVCAKRGTPGGTCPGGGGDPGGGGGGGGVQQ